MYKFLKVAAVAAAAALSACASGPAFNDMKSSVPPLASDQGRIYFYRTAVAGAAVQPSVTLNGETVGSAVPDGFFYVDHAAGNCEVVSATEVANKLTFTLDPAQTRYVRLDLSMGLFVGHIVPRLVDDETGEKEIQGTKYAGTAVAKQ